MKYKILEEFLNYKIYEDGTIKSTKRTKELKLRGTLACLNTQYRQYGLYSTITNKTKLIYGHQLVCRAFHGPAPSLEHKVLHRDGDTFNNHKDNLIWATDGEIGENRIRLLVEKGHTYLTPTYTYHIKRNALLKQRHAQGIFSYKEAIETNKEYYTPNRPCNKCSTSKKHMYNRLCVECYPKHDLTKARQYEYFKECYERQKKRQKKRN